MRANSGLESRVVEDCFAFGPFIFDASCGALSRDGRPVAVGQRALSVLHALVRANGEVVTKSDLIDIVWPGLVVEESNLSVQIAALRKALEGGSGGDQWIVTVARVGYRFARPAVRADGAARGPAGAASLAVLPFDNLSGKAAREYFADGVTEDIIAALSRFKWFRVAARNSSFAFKGRSAGAADVARALCVTYVLTGSVRRSATRIRISVQLIDARSATQLWAERYDFAPGELFSVQDEIANQVVGAIEPELLKTQALLAVDDRRRDQDLTGWDLVHRGTWYFHQVTRATHLRARELFREACMAAPQLTEAHAWRGRVSAGIVAYGWSEDAASDLREGLDAAATAVRIDPKNPYAHYSLAITSVFAEEFDQAVRAAEMAVELSPGFALGHLVLGMARLFSGDAAHAIGALERGLRLNPYDPQNFVWYNLLGLAHFFTGHAEPALDAAKHALKVRPDWTPALETLVLAHLAAGRRDAARECAARLPRGDPAAADALAPLRRANPRWNEAMTASLRSVAPGARAEAVEPAGEADAVGHREDLHRAPARRRSGRVKVRRSPPP